MAQYGKTWWGKKWLEAFNDIDFSNRLSRGKTYANKGAVHAVSIKENTITAKVHGSRRYPYKIKIIQRNFSKAEKEKIFKIIHDSPVILSRLINRELPESLLKQLLLLGIHLFPEQWDDLESSCSCPDWALPCKHLAAAIYLIANKIDRDPFLVFELRGFDLLNQLEETGLGKIEIVQDIICIEKQFSKSINSDLMNNALTKKVDLSLIVDLVSNVN